MQADLNRQTKASGQAIGQLMKEGKRDEAEAVKAGLRDLGDRIAALSAEAKRLEAELDDLLFYLPNLPSQDTPPGPEENFQIVKTLGRAEDRSTSPPSPTGTWRPTWT